MACNLSMACERRDDSPSASGLMAPMGGPAISARTATIDLVTIGAAAVVSILALDIGGLFSGALIIELMFGYPGMGKLLFDAIMGNDYNLALVALLFATCVTLAANLAADVLYAVIDPRVSFGRTGDA